MSQPETAARAQALMAASVHPSQALAMAAGMSHPELVALALWFATAIRATGMTLLGAPPAVTDAAVNRAVLAAAIGVRNDSRSWGRP